MQYENGYPTPNDDSPTVSIDDVTFSAGDQFRYPIGTEPFTGNRQYGLCYVLDVDDEDTPRVRFFNVSEEGETVHTLGELRGALERGELHKLDESWSE